MLALTDELTRELTRLQARVNGLPTPGWIEQTAGRERRELLEQAKRVNTLLYVTSREVGQMLVRLEDSESWGQAAGG